MTINEFAKQVTTCGLAKMTPVAVAEALINARQMWQGGPPAEVRIKLEGGGWLFIAYSDTWEGEEEADTLHGAYWALEIYGMPGVEFHGALFQGPDYSRGVIRVERQVSCKGGAK